MIKHNLEEIRDEIIKKLNKIPIGKTCVEKKSYLLFLSKFVSSCCFDLLKKEHILNFNEISLKKRGKFILKHYFILHLICYIGHQWFDEPQQNLCFRINFYTARRRSQKITMIFFTEVKHTSWCLLRPWYNEISGYQFNCCLPSMRSVFRASLTQNQT